MAIHERITVPKTDETLEQLTRNLVDESGCAFEYARTLNSVIVDGLYRVIDDPKNVGVNWDGSLKEIIVLLYLLDNQVTAVEALIKQVSDKAYHSKKGGQ